MKCPQCGANDDTVFKKSVRPDGLCVLRRRQCQRCGRCFKTHEVIEEAPHPGRPRLDEIDHTDPASLRVHDLPRRLRVFTKGAS